jgi:hypothetical protein
MLEPQVRHELLLLLGQAVEGELDASGKARMHEIMLKHNPRYSILREDQWVDAGLVLAGAWRLAEALEQADAA